MAATLVGRKILCRGKDVPPVWGLQRVNRWPRGRLSAFHPSKQHCWHIRSSDVTDGHYSTLALALAFACYWNKVHDLPCQKGN